MSARDSATAAFPLLLFCLVSRAAGRTTEDLTFRIINGDEAAIEDFPYQLAMEGENRQMCGASVLTRDWALTAAHCVYQNPPKWLFLRSGSALRSKGGTLHSVKSYEIHPRYDRKSLDYDVALVLVREPFTFKTGTRPVLLPSRPPAHGDKVKVAGWGFLQKERLSKPKELMSIDIYAINWDHCKRMFPTMTRRMMCAGFGKKDICSGDSGGPLMRGVEQVGVVSWTQGCGDGYPSVYTNLSTVLDWVVKTTALDDFISFPEDY